MITELLPCPEPGVYEDVPMEVYLRWDAISNTGLGYMLRSPAHYQAYLHEPSGDSEAQLIGRAAHMAILEPPRFEQTFYRIPKPDPHLFTNKDGSPSKNPANTSAYKEAVRAMADENPDKVGLKDELWEDVLRMRRSALLHPRLRKVIESTGRAELSIVWRDPKTGALCKCRLDWHTPTYAGGAIVDLKTTPDAAPWAFGGSANKWGYYRQGAMHSQGTREAGLPVAHFTFAAIEKKPAVLVGDEVMHGVVLYRLRDEDLSLGNEQVDYALALYAECKRTGEWPGYPTDVLDLTLPAWAGQDIERNAEELVA